MCFGCMLLQILVNHFWKVVESGKELWSVRDLIVIGRYSFKELLVGNSEKFSLSWMKEGWESDRLDMGR